MNTECFKIDLFVFTTHYKVSPDCKRKLADFLYVQGYSKSVVELYEDFIHRSSKKNEDVSYLLDRLTYKTAWKENQIDNASQREMIQQLYNSMDLVDNPEGYAWQNRINFYYFPNEFNFSVGFVLNQPIHFDYNNQNDHPLFSLIFVEMLSQTQWPVEFLNYHQSTTFQNESNKYKLFLKDCQDQLAMRKAFLKQWIKNNLRNRQQKDLTGVTSDISLETLIPISKLNALRTLLVKKEILIPYTFNWKDKSKGSKGRISAFIQVLEDQGYFGQKRFNGNEISQIIHNSFGISIDAKTANDSLKNSTLKKPYNFIPPCSSIS